MEKIKLNERDLKKMIKECLSRVLNERTSYGYMKGEENWAPFYDEYITEKVPTEKLEKLVQRGLIPEELDDDFLITKTASSEYDRGNYDREPSYSTGESSFGGDYDKAKSLISQIRNKELQILFQDALDMFCESLEGDFEEDTEW